MPQNAWRFFAGCTKTTPSQRPSWPTPPFELLIAVILSAQATDVGVNKATARLFPVANTPEAIHALGWMG
jgi:endonuclease III